MKLTNFCFSGCGPGALMLRYRFRAQPFTMYARKGLEFMAVALVALNDGLIPHALALRAAPDKAGKEEVINAERMLLYVAATRAKKWLLASSSGKPSEILEPQATAE